MPLSIESTISNPLLRADRVDVVFPGGYHALESVDLQLQQGEFVALIGPSGCGKSTLLRLLAGLHSPTAGHVRFGDGAEPGSHAAPRTAFVFQEANLLPWRTVAGNICLPLELQHVPKSTQRQALHESLELIGLTPADARKRPRMLSGGMRMRVSLARALVTDPELLLLDEPFAALDDILRQQLNEDLSRIWQSTGTTAVFVTHNVGEAVFLSQRILIMSRGPGRIAQEISVPFAYPRSPELRYSAEFAEFAGEVSRQLWEASA